MTTKIPLPLIALSVAVYLFLVGPLIIVFGAALSDTTYLTFPPQGLTLRWFERIFEISAFRRTIVTSLQLALMATGLALLIGIPAAYALNRYRIQLPAWLSTVFVLPILVPGIYSQFPHWSQMILGNGLARGTITAAVVNAMFHFGAQNHHAAETNEGKA